MATLPALFVDIDGVLAFQPEGSILAANARFGTSLLVAECTAYDWAATLPKEQQAWVKANLPVIAANLAPDTLAVKVIGKARKAGYSVTVATERDPSLTPITRAWLLYWGIAYDALKVVGSGNKPDLIRAQDRDLILIDDDPAKEDLAGDGVQVWVPPRPWTPQGDAPKGVWRFGSWRDAKKKLDL